MQPWGRGRSAPRAQPAIARGDPHDPGATRRAHRLGANFGHWYPRGRAALGLFDYDQRGILDRGHVRFFMRRGFLARLRHAGFTVVRQEATGLPLEVLAHGDGTVRRTLRVADRLAVTIRPTLFGYQFVAQCETLPAPQTLEHAELGILATPNPATPGR